MSMAYRLVGGRGAQPLTGLLILVAACSSAPILSTTGAVPASVAIASGDGQSAAPDSALAVPLSVIVRNASGAAVPSVVVTFTVDSGGGSLANLSATTASNGIAIAGVWRLGAAAGTNVVEAKVGSLAPVKFHAQAFGPTARTVFDNSPVGAGGGTLQYTKPGDPLNGLMLTVPAGAYPTATHWTIVADSSLVVPLPAGISQLGPVLVVSNAQGYADSVLTLTLPLSVASTIAVAPFYFDPTTRTFEGIPLVARTATSVTLAARHFSGDLMVIPGTGLGAGSRASARLGFGSVNIVWVQVPQAQLIGTYTSGFQVGVDNWEFPNYGDYIGPGGDCEGMSITEMYYYYFIASGGRPHLYHHFDVSRANPWDNVQGIRFAGSVQGDFLANWSQAVNQMSQLISVGLTKSYTGVDPATLTSTWIVLTLEMTHQPVLIGLQGGGLGHAVVAYAATATGVETDVSFADPNVPTTPRIMKFNSLSGTMDPVLLATKANAQPQNFTLAFALGVSAEVPIASISTRWSEFLNKTSGSDRYPSQYTFEYFNWAAQGWDSLRDTVRTTKLSLQLRVRCPGCPQQLPGQNPADAQQTQIFNDSGTVLLATSDLLSAGVSPNVGTAGYVAVANAASPYSTPPGDLGFLDSHNFTLIYSPLTITSPGLQGRPDTTYAFVAGNGGVAVPSSQFLWSFGDGSPNSTVLGDSTVGHRYASIGTYQMSVLLLDSLGRTAGGDTVVVTITHVAWQVSTVAVSSALPPGGIGSDVLDTLTQETVNASLSSLPGDLLFRVDSATCSAAVIELGSGADSGLVFGLRKGVFASNCGGFGGSFQMGTLGSGTLSGSVSRNVVPNGALLATSSGSINAVMTGAAMNGTISWTVPYSGGDGVYTIQFSAVQVTPTPAYGTIRMSTRKP